MTALEDRRQRLLVLVGVCAALVAVQASVAALNVAVPQIALDVGASQGDLLWIVNSYTLALAALLLPLGALGDRIGRRPVLLGGLVVFSLATLGASQAGSAELLIAMRVLAGVGGAMILPATLSVITATFPADARGTAIGVWTGCAGSGALIGLVGASFIVDAAAWPWALTLILVPAAVALVLVVVAVPDSRERPDTPPDWVGSVASVAAIGGLVLAIQEGPERGWTNPLTLTGLVAGGVGLLVWVGFALRSDAPLLDLRLFRVPRLAGSSLSLVVLFAVNFGLFLLLIQYLLTVLGYSAVRAAASMGPIIGVMLVVAPFAPTIAARLGRAVTVSGGVVLNGIGVALIASQAHQLSYTALLPGLILFGIGIGVAMAPATTGITESLPEHQQGVASALNDIVREVGGALGIAVMGTIANAVYRSSVGGFADGLDPHLADTVRDGITSSYAAAASLPDELAGPLVATTRDAFIDGWAWSMWLGCAALLATGVAAFVILRAGQEPTTAETVSAPAERSLVD